MLVSTKTFRRTSSVIARLSGENVTISIVIVFPLLFEDAPAITTPPFVSSLMEAPIILEDS